MITVKEKVVDPCNAQKMASFLKNLGYLAGSRRGERTMSDADALCITVQSKSGNFIDRLCGERIVHCRLSWDVNFSRIEMGVYGRGKQNAHFEEMKQLAEKISLYFDKIVDVILVTNEFKKDSDTDADGVS